MENKKKIMMTSQCVILNHRPQVDVIAVAVEMIELVFAACPMLLPIFNILFFSLVEALCILSRLLEQHNHMLPG